jgi:hypothetical protein
MLSQDRDGRTRRRVSEKNHDEKPLPPAPMSSQYYLIERSFENLASLYSKRYFMVRI